MAELRCRLVTLDDSLAIDVMLQQAITFLHEQGIDQWQNRSVTIDHILPVITRQDAYCWIDEYDIIQAFAVLEDYDINYDQLTHGRWLFDGPYYAIHRVMMAESSRGKGYTRFVFSDIEKIAYAHHKNSLRIDTHQDNVIMQKSIIKMGFRHSGEAVVADGTSRIIFEKSL